jgi:hypothetical protein
MNLAEIYAEDQRLQLNSRLVQDAIQERFPGLAVEAAIVLDRADLTSLTTELGGVTVGDRLYVGAQLLEKYDVLAITGTQDQMAFQKTVFDALLVDFARRNWTGAELMAVLKRVVRNRADARQLATLESIALDAPPFANSKLIWRTYTSELESGAP